MSLNVRQRYCIAFGNLFCIKKALFSNWNISIEIFLWKEVQQLQKYSLCVEKISNQLFFLTFQNINIKCTVFLFKFRLDSNIKDVFSHKKKYKIVTFNPNILKYYKNEKFNVCMNVIIFKKYICNIIKLFYVY